MSTVGRCRALCSPFFLDSSRSFARTDALTFLISSWSCRQRFQVGADDIRYSNFLGGLEAKTSAPTFRIYPIFSSQCGKGDSNPHFLRNQILSLSRLPVPPSPRGAFDKLAERFCNSKYFWHRLFANPPVGCHRRTFRFATSRFFGTAFDGFLAF